MGSPLGANDWLGGGRPRRGLRAGVDGGLRLSTLPLGFAAALEIKLLKIFKFFPLPLGGKWLRGEWAGENWVFAGLSSEDRGGPGEAELSAGSTHPRSAGQKPLEQDLGSGLGGRSEGWQAGRGQQPRD